MLELRLRSGQVVTFDGRIVEVFAAGEPSRRFHLAQLEGLTTDDGPAVELADVTLAFAPEEAPARARLLAAVAQAQAALERDV